ncbi:MAG: hypothetical protein DBX47_02430 [Clostridiales bacterium]|nr:MAG: hypothetical protein DBX47_02430 [Clostridiales bacterium]
MKKIVYPVLLGLICSLLCSACSVKRISPEVTAYVVDNAQKVMKEQSLSYKENSLQINLAKNEYEGMQFILNNGMEDFKVKDVSVSKLTHENGKDFIGTDSITVYRQHYMYVDIHYYTYTGYPDGYYPDALIETKYDSEIYPEGFPVTKNENQGYWITVYSEKNQTAGNYTGEVTVVTDKKTLTIPIECKVYDFEISEDVHFKTYYGLFETNNYEGQMAQYYEFFKKYRMSSWRLPIEDMAPEEKYLNAAQTYATGSDITSYFVDLNGRRGWVEDPVFGKIYRFHNDFISMTNKLNAITPGKVYALTHDEPEHKGSADPNSDDFWAKGVEWFTGVANNDLPNVKTVITHDNKLPTFGSPAGFIRYTPDVWCIKPSNTVEGDAADMHANGKELWWYTCNWPVYPAMNTHIDSDLVAARLLAWMGFDYNIDGYLCYAATIMGRATNAANPDPNVWQNPYNYLDENGGGDPAGDGYVVIQGREGDGVINQNVPVPTIRLEALRDGMEDYEYLYNYKQKLNKIIADLGIDLDANDAMQMFYDALYNGTTDFDSDTQKFVFTRNDLAQKICEDVNFVYYITRGNENYDCGKRTIYVYSDGTQPVTINGKTVQGENGKYSLTVDIDETKYRNDFNITVGDKQVSVHCYPDIVSKSTVLTNIDDFKTQIIEANKRMSVSVENGKLIADFTKDSKRVNIPFEALTGVSDYTPYSHIRVKMETADGSYIPAGDMTFMAKSGASTTVSFKACPSGSVVDIPINDEFLDILKHSPLKLVFSYGVSNNTTILISDIKAIFKDVQIIK